MERRRTTAALTSGYCFFALPPSIGFGDGSEHYRKKVGVMGSGPYRVTTNQALFCFDEDTHRMRLLEVVPGKTAGDIQEQVSFELLILPDLKEMKEPSAKDLRLLRKEGGPVGSFLKRKPSEVDIRIIQIRGEIIYTGDELWNEETLCSLNQAHGL
jgi:hypothetical protein